MSMELVMAFATIVSLIGQFRSERRAEDQSNSEEFMKWLVEKDHTEIKNLLENNKESLEGINSLLSEQYDSLMEKLDALDQSLASFASGVEGFDNLSKCLKPESVLSDQAISILKQFEESGDTEMIEFQVDVEKGYLFPRQNKHVNIENNRFVEDDLSFLVELGLLRPDLTSRGNNRYVYTRAASRLVKLLGS